MKQPEKASTSVNRSGPTPNTGTKETVPHKKPQSSLPPPRKLTQKKGSPRIFPLSNCLQPCFVKRQTRNTPALQNVWALPEPLSICHRCYVRRSDHDHVLVKLYLWKQTMPNMACGQSLGELSLECKMGSPGCPCGTQGWPWGKLAGWQSCPHWLLPWRHCILYARLWSEH